VITRRFVAEIAEEDYAVVAEHAHRLARDLLAYPFVEHQAHRAAQHHHIDDSIRAVELRCIGEFKADAGRAHPAPRGKPLLDKIDAAKILGRCPPLGELAQPVPRAASDVEHFQTLNLRVSGLHQRAQNGALEFLDPVNVTGIQPDSVVGLLVVADHVPTRLWISSSSRSGTSICINSVADAPRRR
jgi:hypothetical protein